MLEVQPVANYHCITGENPLWNQRDQRIYWEDIDSGRLFRADHRTLEHECFYRGETVGGFTFQDDGSLLLFEADRIAVLDSNGKRRVIAQGIDSDMRRFNDVIADPEGRVFAGTIGSTSENGGLYRVDLDGHVSALFKGTGCANGMGFTPDLSQFYWTCSTTRTIFVFDYVRETGALENRRVFYRAPAAEGSPGFVSHRLIVDVDDAGAEAAGELDGALQGLGDHADRQAVLAGVVDGDGLLVGVERDHRQDRAEDLLVVHPHAGGGAGDHRGLVEQPLVRAAGEDAGAAGDGVVDHLLHPTHLPHPTHLKHFTHLWHPSHPRA